jgi:hypothetical protein
MGCLRLARIAEARTTLITRSLYRRPIRTSHLIVVQERGIRFTPAQVSSRYADTCAMHLARKVTPILLA